MLIVIKSDIVSKIMLTPKKLLCNLNHATKYLHKLFSKSIIIYSLDKANCYNNLVKNIDKKTKISLEKRYRDIL